MSNIKEQHIRRQRYMSDLMIALCIVNSVILGGIIGFLIDYVKHKF